MDAAQLQDAFVGVADWVAAATGGAAEGAVVRLPSTSASISLRFPIIGRAEGAPTDGATLTKAPNGRWVLNFVLPFGSDQLQGVLPGDGECAIWISEASFVVVGARPNGKGNIIAEVATSGVYQNGLGSEPAVFATKALSGDYAYHAESGVVYSPWKIDSSVYMTPTPYTQWSLTFGPNGGDPSTAEAVEVHLTVAYMSAPA